MVGAVYFRGMKLGLLGPAPDHQDELERAARWLVEEQGADRVVYLGSDRMLNQVVSAWAERLVGPRADDFSVMTRATEHCLKGTPSEIDSFLNREVERSKLRIFESLQGESTRSVDLIGGKVAVMLYDKAKLEEEDILPATLLIFGKSRRPMMKVIGRRWFLSPGAFPHNGVMVIEDADEKLRASTFGAHFEELESQELASPRALKMRVTGES
jgi:hypothetical protein